MFKNWRCYLHTENGFSINPPLWVRRSILDEAIDVARSASQALTSYTNSILDQHSLYPSEQVRDDRGVAIWQPV